MGEQEQVEVPTVTATRAAGGMSRRRMIAGSAVVGTAAWLAPAIEALATPAAASAPTVRGGTMSFAKPGSHSWPIPSGVTALTLAVAGAAGGDTTVETAGNVIASSSGGKGASVTTVFPAPTGVGTLYLQVGGRGTSATAPLSGSGTFAVAGGGGGGGAGYQGGGGGGGAAGVGTNGEVYSGGGGGSSSVGPSATSQSVANGVNDRDGSVTITWS